MIFSIKWQVGIISLCRNFQNFPLVSLGKWNLKIVETSQTMAHVIFSWFWRSDNRTPILNVLIMVEDVGEKCMKLYVGEISSFINIQKIQDQHTFYHQHISPTFTVRFFSTLSLDDFELTCSTWAGTISSADILVDHLDGEYCSW